MNHSVVVISSRGPTEAPEVGSGFGGGVAWLLLLNNVQDKQEEHENNWLIQHLPRASCIVMLRLCCSVSGQTICFIMFATLAQNNLLLEAAAKPTHHISNQYSVEIHLLTQLFFLDTFSLFPPLPYPGFSWTCLREAQCWHMRNIRRHQNESCTYELWPICMNNINHAWDVSQCQQFNSCSQVVIKVLLAKPSQSARCCIWHHRRVCSHTVKHCHIPDRSYRQGDSCFCFPPACQLLGAL